MCCSEAEGARVSASSIERGWFGQKSAIISVAEETDFAQSRFGLLI